MKKAPFGAFFIEVTLGRGTTPAGKPSALDGAARAALAVVAAVEIQYASSF
jgi:hypothetical protein